MKLWLAHCHVKRFVHYLRMEFYASSSMINCLTSLLKSLGSFDWIFIFMARTGSEFKINPWKTSKLLSFLKESIIYYFYILFSQFSKVEFLPGIFSRIEWPHVLQKFMRSFQSFFSQQCERNSKSFHNLPTM